VGVALVEPGSCGLIVGCDLGIGRECVNSGAAIGCAAEGRRHKGRVMLKTLVVYRTRIGQVLGIMACTATVICFEYFFEWTWFAAIPVGVLAYITMPILWPLLLCFSIVENPALNRTRLLFPVRITFGAESIRFRAACAYLREAAAQSIHFAEPGAEIRDDLLKTGHKRGSHANPNQHNGSKR
jgi:hypothetical protein